MSRLLIRFFLVVVLFVPTGLWASKRIVIDLTRQIAIAYQDGKVLFYGRISSGKPGHRTPTGYFRILEKDIDHVSNLWPAPNGGARMHYMLRLTRDGVAMHLGPTPNYPASHGCIRMRNGFAQRMFFWAEKGIPVEVKGAPPKRSPALDLPNYADPKSMALYEKATRAVLRAEQTQNERANNALIILSPNPKHHQVHPPRIPPKLKEAIYGRGNSRGLKKYHPGVMRRPLRRDRHPDPLQAVSSH